MDELNWNKERRDLKDEIFKDLRSQQDRENVRTLSGTYFINPQTFKGKGDVNIWGPIPLPGGFRGTPVITFGQQPVQKDVLFLCQFFVNDWVWNGGSVEGFYLGGYTLTNKPVSFDVKSPAYKVDKHIVMWLAYGSSSAYKRDHVTEAWTQQYDYHQDVGNTIDHSREYEL